MEKRVNKRERRNNQRKRAKGGRVQSHMAPQHDIRTIAKQARQGREYPQRKNLQKGDFTKIVGLQGIMEKIIKAQEKFWELPSKIREEKFENEPQKYIEYMNNPKNIPDAIRLGIISKKPAEKEPEKTEPIEVTIIDKQSEQEEK